MGPVEYSRVPPPHPGAAGGTRTTVVVRKGPLPGGSGPARPHPAKGISHQLTTGYSRANGTHYFEATAGNFGLSELGRSRALHRRGLSPLRSSQATRIPATTTKICTRDRFTGLTAGPRVDCSSRGPPGRGGGATAQYPGRAAADTASPAASTRPAQPPAPPAQPPTPPSALAGQSPTWPPQPLSRPDYQAVRAWPARSRASPTLADSIPGSPVSRMARPSRASPAGGEGGVGGQQRQRQRLEPGGACGAQQQQQQQARITRTSSNLLARKAEALPPVPPPPRCRPAAPPGATPPGATPPASQPTGLRAGSDGRGGGGGGGEIGERAAGAGHCRLAPRRR
jgi:hypothetical protein